MNTDEVVRAGRAGAGDVQQQYALPRADRGDRPRDDRTGEGTGNSDPKERHDGEEDVTVITQDAVLPPSTACSGALTMAVAGIAAINLAVAGILVMNVMLSR